MEELQQRQVALVLLVELLVQPFQSLAQLVDYFLILLVYSLVQLVE